MRTCYLQMNLRKTREEQKERGDTTYVSSALIHYVSSALIHITTLFSFQTILGFLLWGDIIDKVPSDMNGLQPRAVVPHHIDVLPGGTKPHLAISYEAQQTNQSRHVHVVEMLIAYMLHGMDMLI